MKTIKIACTGAGVLSIDLMHPIQDEFKTLSDDRYNELKTQILEEGFSAPIFVWEDPEDALTKILDGTQRYTTLIRMRDKESYSIPQIPVVYVEADDVQQAIRKLLGFASQYGTVQEDGFARLLNKYEIEIEDLSGKIYIPSIDMSALEEKLEEIREIDVAGHTREIGGAADEDEVPEVVEPKAKLGEIYRLGDHRLMCGDSTDEDTVATLMNGEKADMVFTDPPYGMFLDTDYDSMFGTDKSHRKTGKRFNEVKGDHEDFTPRLIETIFRNFDYCEEMFIWGADYFTEFLENRTDGSWVVWDKRCNENMDKVSGNTFELCWSKQKHKRLIARIMWSGHHGMQKDDTKTRVHPTQKPSKLIEWFFDQWGKGSKLVADIYGGSGSTLIACEKTNRKCFMMELDPHYVDVIIARWEKFTGQKAELISTPKPILRKKETQHGPDLQ